MDNPTVSGTPSWVVMATPDSAATLAFYGALFGWTADDESGGYTTLRLDGRDVAGMFQLPDEARRAGAASRWLVYIATDDIGDALNKVRPAGGSILAAAFDVPGSGRMAMVADATGAEFGLWEAWGEAGEALRGEPGTLTWAELYTRSRAASANFYGSAFGWDVEEVTAGDQAFVTCSLEGVPVAGMMPMSAAWGETPSHWMPYFSIADVDAAVTMVAGLGGEVAAEPHDTGSGRLAVVRDPLGALFFIVTEQTS